MSKEEKNTDGKVTFPLSKPVKAHGEEVTSLSFRAPDGEDLLEIGAPPFMIDGRERVHIDFAVTGEYISRLAAVPMSTVKLMQPQDLMGAFGIIAGFFGGTEMIRKKSSEAITN